MDIKQGGYEIGVRGVYLLVEKIISPVLYTSRRMDLGLQESQFEESL